MFNNLIESKAKRQRSLGGTIFSVILHTGIIAGAVYATAHATIEAEKPKEEKVEFVEMKKDEPPPPKNEPPPPPPPDVAVAPPPPKGFQVLTAPVKIPDVIPDIDLTKKVTDESDFSGKGVAGGLAKGVVGGTGPVNPEQTYFEFQVEKVASAAPGQPQPVYPEILKNSGVSGEVLAQFVVNVDGHVDMSTFKVLKSTHDLFTAAVRQNLPRVKYYPAEVGGKKVRQLVQQSFVFNLNKS
jgi:protein TonB